MKIMEYDLHINTLNVTFHMVGLILSNGSSKEIQILSMGFYKPVSVPT